MLTTNSADVLHRLERKLQGRSNVDLGQFQLINLDVVREGAGAQWDKLRNKIVDVSAHFIEKRISADDILLRYGDGFLVVFDALDAEASVARTEAISTELNIFFLGDELLRSLNVRSTAHRLDAKQFSQMLGGSPPAEAPANHAKEASDGDEDDNPALGKRLDRPETGDREPPYRFLYRPVWDSAHSAVTAQICVPRLEEKRTGRVFEGRDVLRGHDSPKEHLELDLAIAHKAMEDFLEAHNDNRRLALCLTVGVPAMITLSTRVKYFEALSAIPEELRRYFVLILEGVTAGTPAGAIQEIMRTLRSFCPNVAVHLPIRTGGLDRFSGCRTMMFAAIATDPAMVSAAVRSPNAPLSLYLDGVKKLHSASCLGGLSSGEAVEDAIALGARFLTGTAIADDIEQPVPPYVLTLDDVRERSADTHLV